MILHLRDKKVIFFDVGYTLDMPASGDWMFTNRFLQEAGDKLKTCSGQRISRAKEVGLHFLTQNHLITTVEAEINQFFNTIPSFPMNWSLDFQKTKGKRLPGIVPVT